MTNRTGTAKETNGDSQFIPPVRKPNEKETVKLIEHAIGAGILTCMENHFYRIEDTIRRKKSTTEEGLEELERKRKREEEEAEEERYLKRKEEKMKRRQERRERKLRKREREEEDEAENLKNKKTRGWNEV